MDVGMSLTTKFNLPKLVYFQYVTILVLSYAKKLVFLSTF